MRTRLSLAALALVTLGLAPSCSTRVQGQLMLVLQTDMSLPKDIDRVRIEVTRTETGAIIYQRDFTKLGDQDSIKLPGTLGFLASGNPADAIRIRVIASRGPDQSVRVLREAVTAIPADRVVSLPLAIEFLCNGEVEIEYDEFGQATRDASGNVIVKSTCPEGLTCQAGSCAAPEVDAAALPDYEEKEIFGGGTGDGDGVCFDTSTCFDGGTKLQIDLAAFAADPKRATCLSTVKGEVNVALRTQGGGICGASDCFVALDADSEAGWKVESSTPDGTTTISFPPAVCAKILSGNIVGLVSAPVGALTCQSKRASIPTCGPWSSTGGDVYTPPPPQPAVVVAVGQANPTSIGQAYDTLYWLNRGTFGANGDSNGDGTVKAVSIEGGEPVVLSEKQTLAGLLTLDINRQFVLWTSSEDTIDPATMTPARIGQIMWTHFLSNAPPAAAAPLLALNKPGDLDVEPLGIAVETGKVYWTEGKSEKVHEVATAVDGDTLVATGTKNELANTNPPGSNPYAITVASDAVCWTYRDELGSEAGSVACSLGGQSIAVATGQHTPQAIAIGRDTTGAATAVYWANFDAAQPITEPGLVGGGIFKVDLTGGSPGPVVEIARENHPGGLAIDPDGKTLYWTGHDSGTVMVLRPGELQPSVLVEGQLNPGALTVSDDTVYWINEGPEGAIMKAAKP